MIIGVLCVLVVLLTVFFALDQKDSKVPESQEHGKTVEEMLGSGEQPSLPPVYHNGKTYHYNPDLECYLILGVDQLGEAQASEGYNGGGQSDVILLYVADHTQKKTSLLQINRDTMTQVDVLGVRGDIVGTRYEQIALAHAYGTGLEDSCENAVRAVSRFLYDVKIDGYASIRMEALPVLNDLLGGVTVKIEDDFSQVDQILVQGEDVTLKGDQVLHFIRNRMDVGEGTNLERMVRHRTYLSAFQDVLETKMEKNSKILVQLYDAAMPYVVTDTGSGTISKLAQKCSDYESNGTLTIDGEAKQGEIYVEYYVDELDVKETVLELFYLEEDK